MNKDTHLIYEAYTNKLIINQPVVLKDTIKKRCPFNTESNYVELGNKIVSVYKLNIFLDSPGRFTKGSLLVKFKTDIFYIDESDIDWDKTNNLLKGITNSRDKQLIGKLLDI